MEVKKSIENAKKCICKDCKSYTMRCKLKEMPHNVIEIIAHYKDFETVEHFEGLFCAFGKSKCISEEKECICTKCEVFKENNLTKLYYCTRGL